MKIFFALIFLIPVDLSFANEKQVIPVPKPFRECKVDADCVESLRLCGCCDFVAMNKKFTKKYAALARYCEAPPPPCKCMESKETPKCVKKICELIPR